MTTFGPILKIDNFISPLFCEDIIDRANSNICSVDANGNPLKTLIFNELTEIRYSPYLDDLIENLVDPHYGTEISYISKTTIEWFPENYKNIGHGIDGYHFLNKKWINTSDVDFVTICFLNDFCNKPNFDRLTDVYGGEIIFNNFNLTIKPARGMLLAFPANPAFAYRIDNVIMGDLFVLKNILTSESKYAYNASSFSGTPEEWVKQLSGK
jgi:hypothetical protein